MKQVYLKLFLAIALLCILIDPVKAQNLNGKIYGTITTQDNKPAAGINLLIVEINRATSTNDKGDYQLPDIVPGTYTLRVTAVGIAAQQKRITITQRHNVRLDFTLSEHAKQLTEVLINRSRKHAHQHPMLQKADIGELDLPQSTGVVTNQLINDEQVNHLGDAVRNVAGVTLTQTRGGVGETFTARGYSIGITGSSGSIFKNGVLTNTAGFPEASSLESVEVLKGSSALLYGSTSGGLIINMITKKPKFENGGEVSFRSGSYNTYKPAFDIYGPLGKNLAYRVNGVYENSGSYRSSVHTERAYINPSLQYNAGEHTTLLLEGDYLKGSLTPDWGVGSLDTGRALPFSTTRSRFINTIWAYNHMDQYAGTVTVNHYINSLWRLNVITSAQGTFIDAYGSSLPNTVSPTGEWYRGLARTKTREDDYTTQIHINGTFYTSGIKHQILVGTDAAAVVTYNYAFNISGLSTLNGVSYGVYDLINTLNADLYAARTDIAPSTATVLTKSPSYRLGYYGQDLVSLSEKFKILAGLRYSIQQTVQPFITTLSTHITDRSLTALNRIDKAFSPKLAFLYEPTNHTTAYFTYSNNFIVNTGTDVTTGQALAPSIVTQYETGIKNTWFDGKVNVNIALYQITNSNLAVVAPYKADGMTANTDNTVKTLSGQTTSRGVELEVSGKLSKNFYFTTGYSYNHAYYSKSTSLYGSPLLGEPLVINPAHTANGAVFYTFSQSKLKGLKLGATAYYTGFRYAGYNNTVGQTQKYNRLLPVPGFTTIDLTAGYAYHQLSLLASITNLTNTSSYLIHDNYSVTPIAPTHLLTTVAYKF
jgi:iron complex outermembrane receptor protein